MAELKELTDLRGIIKAKMTRFQTYVINNAANTTKKTELNARFKVFKNSLNEFETIQNKIELLDSSDRQITYREEIENMYFQLIAEVEDILSNSDNQSNRNNELRNSSISDNNVNIQLPMINLPHFSGHYDQWITFIETFNSLIHENKKLSNIQKFHYLRSCLKGEAAGAVESLAPSHSNYEIARNALKSRYENHRLIVKTHDSGSQSNFITERMSNILQLPTKHVAIPISGINQSSTKVNKLIKVSLKSRRNNYSKFITCFILPTITENLPLISVNKEQLKIPRNIKLADDNFQTSLPIDMLLGAEHLWELLCIGQTKLGKNMPYLQRTLLGWIVGGSLPVVKQTSKSQACFALHLKGYSWQVEKSWKMKDYNAKINKFIIKDEDFYGKNHVFKNNCDTTGRFITKLPFMDTVHKLGSTKIITLNRFIALERELNKNPKLNTKYADFLKDYLEFGHMQNNTLDDYLQQMWRQVRVDLSNYKFRQTYWPIDGLQIFKNVLFKNVKWFRTKPRMLQYKIDDSPAKRVQPARPFANSGINYSGPFTIKLHAGRGNKTTQAYIALFVCLVTKANHMEVVSNLTTDAFLNSLKRFIARRGMVTNIYSDNATNFVGAERKLKYLNHLAAKSFSNDLHAELSKLNINWHFIPPRSSHFGGIWEIGVKSVKSHLHKVIGNMIFNFEEMYTFLTCVEAVLNSRPLTPLTNDPSDLEVLTPGHFLIGEPLTAPPEPQLLNLKIGKLSRWQHVERMRQHFWNRWSSDYLVQLQNRPKWKAATTTPSAAVGTMVVLRDENVPPLKWRLGRIIEVHPGHDGTVRVVTVRTANGQFKRAIKQLAVLPIESVDKPNVNV